MNTDARRTDNVFAVIQTVAADKPEFRPGDLASFLRERGTPMGVWEIRGELSRLEQRGVIENDPATGAWSLAAESSRKVG